MTQPHYRWSHPHAWLVDASRDWDANRLRLELNRLALKADSDTLQDLYESEMDTDSYFDHDNGPGPNNNNDTPANAGSSK